MKTAVGWSSSLALLVSMTTGVAYLIWFSVCSVQVPGREVRPVVAHDHPVRVKHGYDFEHKLPPKFLLLTNKKPDEFRRLSGDLNEANFYSICHGGEMGERHSGLVLTLPPFMRQYLSLKQQVKQV